MLKTFNMLFFSLVSFIAHPVVTSFVTNRLTRILLNCLLIVIILNLLLVSLAEIIYPYPREYRDGALIDIAHQFVIGANPYTIDNSLPHTYTYGFLPSFFVASLSRFLSIDLVLSQHLITFICIVLLCFLIGKEVFKITHNISLVLVSFVVVLIFNSVSLRGEVLAILLTIATLYFVHHNRALNFKKILLLSLSVITLFYIKQYFILLLPVLCTYFILNQSKKNLIYLLITTLVFGVTSYLVIKKIFPLYFAETLISYINYSGGPTTWVGHKSDYIIKQSVDFIQLYWLIFLLFVVASIIGFVKKRTIQVKVTDINKPLLLFPNTPISDIYFLYGFVSILFLTFLLGYNGGAYLTYYFQLLPLPLCIFGICYLYTRLQKYKLREVIFTFIIILFIGEYYIYLSVPAIDRTNQRLAWENVVAYINKQNGKDIYLTPIFTTEAVKRGWPVYDNGQTDFYPVIQLTPNSQQFSFLSPKDEDIATRIKEWQNEIDNKMINKKFSLVVLPKGHRAIINEEYLVKYYSIRQKMNIPINFGDLGVTISPLYMRTIEFWEPK